MPKLKIAKIESCQNWKCQNWKLLKLKKIKNGKLLSWWIDEIQNWQSCQHWKLPKLKIVENCLVVKLPICKPAIAKSLRSCLFLKLLLFFYFSGLDLHINAFHKQSDSHWCQFTSWCFRIVSCLLFSFVVHRWVVWHKLFALGTIHILRQQKDWVGRSRKGSALLTFSTVFMVT